MVVLKNNKTWYDRLKDSAARTFYPNHKSECGWSFIDMEYLAKTIPVWSFVKASDYNVPLLFAQLLITAKSCHDNIVDLGPSWVSWMLWLIGYGLSLLTLLFFVPTTLKWKHGDKVQKCLEQMMPFDSNTSYNNREYRTYDNSPSKAYVHRWTSEFDKFLHQCARNVVVNGIDLVKHDMMRQHQLKKFADLADMLILPEDQP